MKRLFSMILALTILCTAFPALAEGAMIHASLPSEIYAFFSSASFRGYTIGAGAYEEFHDTIGGDFAFAVASKENTHILYGFEKKNGVWQYWLKNGSVLPQMEGDYLLGNAKGTTDLNTDITYQQDVLSMALVTPGTDYYSHFVCFTVNSYGQWHLKTLDSYLLKTGKYTSAYVYPDHIAYYDEGTLLGHAWGVVETNLRYVNVSAFPATLTDARSVLSNPPDIPYNSQLTATEIQFTGGQKFPVYSGPGEDYERAASGKATVSTNDWIQVFGEENGYILIQYDITADQMRFGYIEKSALPQNTFVSNLNFDYEDAVLIQNTYLTDDPLNSQTRLRTLSKDQGGIQWLATMGNWVYVEVITLGKPIRGFVPAAAISRASDRQVYTTAFSNAEYTAQATISVDESNAITASIVVSAPSAWFDGGADPIQGYQLYANHVSIPAFSNRQQIASAGKWHHSFTLSAALPQGTSVVGLCPIRSSGQKANEALILSLKNP